MLTVLAMPGRVSSIDGRAESVPCVAPGGRLSSASNAGGSCGVDHPPRPCWLSDSREAMNDAWASLSPLAGYWKEVRAKEPGRGGEIMSDVEDAEADRPRPDDDRRSRDELDCAAGPLVPPP